MAAGSEACHGHLGGSDRHASNVVLVMSLCQIILVVLAMLVEAG